MSEVAEVAPRLPGPRAWAALTVAEAKMVIRDTAGLIVPFGMPLLVLVMNGMADRTEAEAAGIPVLERYVTPLVLVMVLAVIGVVNMPSFLAYYRKTKVLRRLAATPADPGMILIAQAIVGMVQAAIGVALALGAATVFFDLGRPEHLWATTAVLVLTATTMFAVGMFVAAVAPSGNAAVAVGLAIFFVFGASGGLFGPVDNLPGPLQAIGEALPFGAAVRAVGDAWVGVPTNPAHLLAMGAAILISGAVALVCFRWD